MKGTPWAMSHSTETAPMLDHETHGVVVAEIGASDVSVADVVGERVRVVHHGGNAALRPARGAVQQLVLGDQGHLVAFSRRSAADMPASPAAQDENVVTAQNDPRSVNLLAGRPSYRDDPETASQRNEILELYNTAGANKPFVAPAREPGLGDIAPPRRFLAKAE